MALGAAFYISDITASPTSSLTSTFAWHLLTWFPCYFVTHSFSIQLLYSCRKFVPMNPILSHSRQHLTDEMYKTIYSSNTESTITAGNKIQDIAIQVINVKAIEHHRLLRLDMLRLLCSKLLILPSSPVAKPFFSAGLDFFESKENAFPTGMLRRRIHPFGFSGRRVMGG